MPLCDFASIVRTFAERGPDRLSAGTIQFFSLRTKFLLLAAALVLIPAGIYGAITASQSRAAIADLVSRQLI